MKFSTKTIHVGNSPNYKEGGSGDVVVPIHLATTFAREKVDMPTDGYDYSRSGNPTRSALEKNLADLESGTFAFAYSSGLAATTNVFLLLSPGDQVVAVNNIYGGTYRLLEQVFGRWGLTVTYAPFSNGKELLPYIRNNTRCIWLESPTNPLLNVVDIASVVKQTKKRGIVTVIDNTFATPYLQNPLTLGVDIVVHSATKYLGGHSDVTAGAVIVKREDLGARIGFLQNAVGAVLSPYDSYQLLKGIKTLPVRMDKHLSNTKKVVSFLTKQKLVKSIYYPGLPTHPGFGVAKKQMKGFGAMVSFELHGSEKTAKKFLESLRLIHIAISLGAVESLIEHPASMTHASVPREERIKAGLSDTLIRLSVGIEDVDDIVSDLRQAFSRISS